MIFEIAFEVQLVVKPRCPHVVLRIKVIFFYNMTVNSDSPGARVKKIMYFIQKIIFKPYTLNLVIVLPCHVYYSIEIYIKVL